MLDESSCTEKICAYTEKDWQPLIDLISEIESTTEFGIWKGGEKNDNSSISIPWQEWKPILHKFMNAVHSIPIMIRFDWPAWDVGRYIANVDFDFDTVDLVTKCKLITVLVRNERFCEGALVSAFESGLMLKLLKSIQKEVVAKAEYDNS